jgi:hypothetical protein
VDDSWTIGKVYKGYGCCGSGLKVPLGSGFIWFSSGQVQVLPLP